MHGHMKVKNTNQPITCVQRYIISVQRAYRRKHIRIETRQGKFIKRNTEVDELRSSGLLLSWVDNPTKPSQSYTRRIYNSIPDKRYIVILITRTIVRTQFTITQCPPLHLDQENYRLNVNGS